MAAKFFKSKRHLGCMHTIILAAGFATRLYPLTLNNPKPLLTVSDKTILDYIVEKVNELSNDNKIIIISNGKFYNLFL